MLPKENKNQQMKKQEAVFKPTRPSNTESGPGRPPKVSNEQKASNDMKFQKKSDKPALQKRPFPVPQDVSSSKNYLD